MDLFLENDIAVILEPLEHSITDVLIPAFIEHAVTEVECDLLAHSMHLGGLGLVKASGEAISQFKALVKTMEPLASEADCRPKTHSS